MHNVREVLYVVYADDRCSLLHCTAHCCRRSPITLIGARLPSHRTPRTSLLQHHTQERLAGRADELRETSKRIALGLSITHSAVRNDARRVAKHLQIALEQWACERVFLGALIVANKVRLSPFSPRIKR